MSSRSMGSLSLDLLVKTGAFIAGMTKAERELNKNLTAMEKRAYKFGQTIGAGLKLGAVAATAAFGALTVAVSKAIDNADAMRDLSIRTGIATEKLSEYAYAAKQTGTDIDGLSRGLKLLSKNAAEALDSDSSKGKLFEALGVNVKDAEGNLKSLDALLPEVADKFKELEDGTTKAALAQELFGKSGLEMIEFLNQGADGLEKAGDKARELGIIISGDTAAAADEFNDKLGDLKAIGEAFALQIAAELLPRLIDMIDYFREGAQEGRVLGTSIGDIGTAFDLFAGQVEKANEVGESTRLMFAGINLAVSSLKEGLSSLVNIDLGGFIKKMNDARSYAAATLLAGFNIGTDRADFSGVTSSGPANFSGVTSSVQGRNDPSKALRDYFSGSGGSGKAAGGAKKEKVEVDKLQESYNRLTESMAEQIALFGQTGEAAKVRYDLENGELAKLTEAQKAVLIGQAEQLDNMKLMEELEDAASKRTRDESEKYAEQIQNAKDVNAAIEEEIALLGMNWREQEIYNNLRAAGVEANSEFGRSIVDNTEKLQQAREEAALWGDVTDSLSDALFGLATDAGNAADIVKDFFDSVAKSITRSIADDWAGKITDLFRGKGASSTGSAGGGFDWASLIGMFFGGGKASGGPVSPGMFYRVNENGPEMLSVSGKDYLMMGSNSGVVTPNSGRSGGGSQIIQNFINPVMADRETDSQRQREAGTKIQRQMARA